MGTTRKAQTQNLSVYCVGLLVLACCIGWDGVGVSAGGVYSKQNAKVCWLYSMERMKSFSTFALVCVLFDGVVWILHGWYEEKLGKVVLVAIIVSIAL